MNLFKALFRSCDKPADGFRPQNLYSGSPFMFGNTSAGKVINERTALSVTTVYACVRVLAEALAGLPLHVYHYNSDGGKERVPTHPLYRLLHDAPNNEMTSFVFRETLMGHLLIYGNGFAQIIRDGRGQVSALYPLLPSNMDVTRDRDSGEIVYTYRSDKGEVKLTRWEVLHIPALGFDGLLGYSPIAMVKNAIGLSMATEDFGSTFFANGASPSGVLSHPGILKDHDKLRESWKALFSGNNAHNVAVLEEGLKYQQISISPNDAQFLETRRFQLEEIARIYRVPLHLIGDLEHATFSNVEHMSLDFCKFTIAPWLRKLEQAFQKSLLLPFERRD